MKKLLLLCSIISFTLSGFATHLMGGQITSRQLSGLTYEITITVYRDTVGVQIGSTFILKYKEIASGITIQNNVPHSGAVTFLNGVEEYTYIDTITFQSTGLYEITWNNCCRNGAILNAFDPLSESMTLRNILLVDSANSSPVFLNPPVVLAQVNDTFYYNPLPFDSDGDSITWKIDTPISSISSVGNIYYISGYTSPFAAPGGAFTMDSLTGEITWIPNTQGHFVTSFIIEEFRNGVKIGEIRRDMQYIVVDVPGNINRAYIDTQGWPVDANDNYRFNVQINTPFSLSVIAHDGDGDLLDVLSNGEPLLLSNNPAVWTNISSSPGYSENTFTWNTTVNEMRVAPYLVTFRILETHGNFTLVRDETVQFKVGNFTSIEEENSLFTIGNIYPVPSTGSLYFPVTVKKDSDLKISFINQLGQEVKKLDKKLSIGQNLLYFSDLNLTAGIYFINTIIEGEKQVRKLVIE